MGNLAWRLRKRGHKVDILAASDFPMIQIGEIKFVYGIWKIFNKELKKYDIINVHGHTPLFSDLSLLIARTQKRRMVYTLHCLMEGYPFSTLYNRIVNGLLRYVDCVVVTSTTYSKFIQSRNRTIIPWGVDYEFFNGARIPHEKFRVLFVGQLRKYKGLDYLIEAMKDVPGILNVVGSGPLGAFYREKGRRELGDRFIFHGTVTDEKLRELYLSNDVFVLPSIDMREAFGLVTLEAAAAGCAVVATDLPGVREVVNDFGILIQPRDIGSLRKTLQLLTDFEYRNNIATKNFIVKKKYSWEKTSDRYEKLYYNIIKKN